MDKFIETFSTIVWMPGVQRIHSWSHATSLGKYGVIILSFPGCRIQVLMSSPVVILISAELFLIRIAGRTLYWSWRISGITRGKHWRNYLARPPTTLFTNLKKNNLLERMWPKKFPMWLRRQLILLNQQKRRKWDFKVSLSSWFIYLFLFHLSICFEHLCMLLIIYIL